MTQGIVKWFDTDKGFGFITPDDGTKDLFVHHTAILDREGSHGLADNQRVEFNKVMGNRGPQAEEVRAI